MGGWDWWLNSDAGLFTRTIIGAAIFAFLAAGTFKTIDQAQRKVCPSYTVFEPQAETRSVYDTLYELYRKIYFEFGRPAAGSDFGNVLPQLIQIARGADKSE